MSEGIVADCPTTGLWADPEVPHSGWEPVDVQVEPEMAPFMRCQMCLGPDPLDDDLEHLRHADYHRLVAAGSCCAHFMQVGPGPGWKAPTMKIPEPNYELDRLTWDSELWSPWLRGGVHRYAYDFEILIEAVEWCQKVGNVPCRITMKHVANGNAIRTGRIVFKNLAEAKARSFDAVLWAIKNLRSKDKEPPRGWPEYFAPSYDKRWNEEAIKNAPPVHVYRRVRSRSKSRRRVQRPNGDGSSGVLLYY